MSLSNIINSISKTVMNSIEDFKDYANETSDVGKTGEYYTFQKLKNIFPENRIFRNVYLKNYYGNYREIDLLAVSPQGIFVFESKNYSGWIFGNEDNERWTQTFQSGKKYTFINPIKQNQGHINTLINNLKEKQNIKYYSIIVFSERCTLKNIEYKSKRTLVLNRYNLNILLLEILKKESPCLTEQEIDELCEFFLKYQRPDKEVVIDHAKEIYKCPVCNGDITNAKTTSGEPILICKNYPQCKYSKKIWQQYQKKKF